MSTFLKILITGLLLVLLGAVGTEVIALHRSPTPGWSAAAAPIVVRKSAHPLGALKTVRVVAGRSKRRYAHKS